MKERRTKEEQKTEMEVKAGRLLKLLYNYDLVGDNAYFKNAREGNTKLSTYYDESDYRTFSGAKYVWIKAPYLRLAITRPGDVFLAPNPHSLKSARRLGRIDDFLHEDAWGKSIIRTHTTARRGTGGPGVLYESAVFDYHDLHFIRNKKQG